MADTPETKAHTPGPWMVKLAGTMPNGVKMFWLKDAQISFGSTNTADAHLAAAAPAMLNALIDCADSLEAEVADRWGDDPRLAHKRSRDMEPILAARAAIHSATGGSHG